MQAVAPTDIAPTETLIDALLAEQRSLTAVEHFARWHDQKTVPPAHRYQALLPAAPPGPGQQYAFEVDLDACSGCKACVTACHSLNGLEEAESWRSVGLLLGTPGPAPLPPSSLASGVRLQHVTTACHHCVEPGCLHGCPVLAYDKDPATGIVRHLDDQCIGCQYCIMKCPYEVPQYSERLGIVRKCDLCTHRLADGEPTACAQACPNAAIRIVVMDPREPTTATTAASPHHHHHHGAAATNSFLPESPDPRITRPTTRYRSRGLQPGLWQAADAHRVRPGQAHAPLTWMLLLTQTAAGIAWFAAAMPNLHLNRTAWAAALGFCVLGQLVATLHLGQPTKAWRVFLGWRRSWLSRELLALGCFSGVLAWQTLAPSPARGVLAALAGLGAVFASAMVYIDTRRAFWRASTTLPKFLLTALLLGACATLSLPLPDLARGLPLWADARAAWPLALIALTVLKLWIDTRILQDPTASEDPDLIRSARVLRESFPGWIRARLLTAALGGVLLPLAWLIFAPGPTMSPFIAAWVFLICLTGEWIERHLFFTAEAARKMPGSL